MRPSFGPPLVYYTRVAKVKKPSIIFLEFYVNFFLMLQMADCQKEMEETRQGLENSTEDKQEKDSRVVDCTKDN